MAFEEHLSGYQHKKNMEVRLKKGSWQGSNEEPNPNMVIQQDTGRKIEFRCEICNIAATSLFGLNTHLSGKNHQKKVRKLKNTEKEPVSKKPKLDSETKSDLSKTKKRRRTLGTILPRKSQPKEKKKAQRPHLLPLLLSRSQVSRVGGRPGRRSLHGDPCFS